MLDYKKRELLDSAYRRAQWVGSAMIGSLFVVAGVVELMFWWMAFTGFAGPGSGFPSESRFLKESRFPADFQYVLLAIGLSDLIFLPFIRRRLLTVPGGGEIDRLLRRLMSVTIITFVISFYPTLMGLVIYLLWGGRFLFYLLWGVSLILLLAYFPRHHFWEDWVGSGGKLDV